MAGAPGPRAGALLRATCALCRAAHPRARVCVLDLDGPFPARGPASHPIRLRERSVVHLPRDCSDQTSPTGVRFKGERARKGAGNTELRRPPSAGRPSRRAQARGAARSASACSCGSTNSTGQCTRGAPRENAREQSGAGLTEWDDEAAAAAATRACCWNDCTNFCYRRWYHAWQWEYIRC